MKQRLFHYIKISALPLSLAVTFLVLFAVWNLFDFPSAEVLAQQIDLLFDRYGLWVLLIGSILEAMLIVGGYFPGAFIIFLSMVTASSIEEALLRIAVGTAGLFIGHLLNYFAGKYGWKWILNKAGLQQSLRRAEEKIERQGPWAIAGTYWLPSAGSIVDVAAGVLNMPFKKFFVWSLGSSIAWDLVVGLTVYFVGEAAISTASSDDPAELALQMGIIAVWISVIIFLDFWREKKNG